jgi:hypothetical protein
MAAAPAQVGVVLAGVPLVSYVAKAQSAAAKVTKAGAAVSFTRATKSGYDPVTGANGSTVTTATSVAIAKVPRGADAERIRGLSLVGKRTVVLLVAGLGLASYVPQADDVVTWAGADYVVRDVSPLNVDGVTAILYTVIAAR